MLGTKTLIRFPVVPGHNDSLDCVEALGDFLASTKSIRDIELLPYHQFGISKYQSLGKKYLLGNVKPPPPEEMARLREVLGTKRLNVLIESMTPSRDSQL